MSRNPDTIQHEIEQARQALATTLDQLAERASPKRLAEQSKRSLATKAKSPVGKAVLAVAAAVVCLAIVRRIRRPE